MMINNTTTTTPTAQKFARVKRKAKDKVRPSQSKGKVNSTHERGKKNN